MSAYIISKINVTDMEQYKEYMKVTPDIVDKYEGRFIARGGDLVTLEGPKEAHRVVLLEFNSLENAKAFYYSDEYQTAKQLREGAATAQFIAIDGV